ncbi:unnamed protein product, partial [Musa textilis]
MRMLKFLCGRRALGREERPSAQAHEALARPAESASRRVTAGDDKPQRRRRRASAWRPSLETIKEERGAPDAADTAVS